MGFGTGHHQVVMSISFGTNHHSSDLGVGPDLIKFLGYIRSQFISPFGRTGWIVVSDVLDTDIFATFKEIDEPRGMNVGTSDKGQNDPLAAVFGR